MLACKDAKVWQEIHQLERVDIPRAEQIEERAKATMDADKQRLDRCEKYAKAQGSSDTCATERKAYEQSKAAHDRARIEHLNLVGKLQVLESLRDCPSLGTPPPPPPPQPKPPTPDPSPPTPPRKPGAPLTVTHRTTNCPPCQGLAVTCNQKADAYSESVSKGTLDEPLAKHEMEECFRALEGCERQCTQPPYAPGVSAPHSPPPPPRSLPLPPAPRATPAPSAPRTSPGPTHQPGGGPNNLR